VLALHSTGSGTAVTDGVAVQIAPARIAEMTCLQNLLSNWSSKVRHLSRLRGHIAEPGLHSIGFFESPVLTISR
jgi:hypothetical protein